MRKRIILKGYYGFGNLGDDILMLVSYKLAQKLFPAHEIILCSNNYHSSYISDFLGESVTIVKDHDNLNADWIINGGGGVYFDFKKGKLKYYLLNKLIHIIGFYSFRNIYLAFRKLKGNQGLTSVYQLGWGIGIGSYTASSQKFFADVVSLSRYDFLLLRDQESLRQIKKHKFKFPAYLATDIAFLYDYWRDEEFIKNDSTRQIGFILRDWEYESNAYLETFALVANQLKHEGYHIHFFSFDQAADQYCKKRFSNEFPFHEWSPSTGRLNSYLQNLANCNLVVTSRAHGAILSACLGVPSVCIGIEPKLEKIARMLKNSASLISQPFEKEAVLSLIRESLNRSELHELVKRDVDKNNRTMKAGIRSFELFLENS